MRNVDTLIDYSRYGIKSWRFRRQTEFVVTKMIANKTKLHELPTFVCHRAYTMIVEISYRHFGIVSGVFVNHFGCMSATQPIRYEKNVFVTFYSVTTNGVCFFFFFGRYSDRQITASYTPK